MLTYAGEAPLDPVDGKLLLIDVRAANATVKSTHQHHENAEALRTAGVVAHQHEAALTKARSSATELDEQSITRIVAVPGERQAAYSILGLRSSPITHVVAFVAGTGLVAIGKFCLAMYFAFCGWNDLRLQRNATIEASKAPHSDIISADIDKGLLRFTFTSNSAFAKASDERGAKKDVSFASP